MIIYKILNTVNNKVYIGLTTRTLELRWRGHLTAARTGVDRHLYCSMRTYGFDKFTIEQIDSADTIEKLGELERYYIRLYNSNNPEFGYNLSAGGEHNQLDGNPRATLTVDEVVQIREIYSFGELSCTDCWEMFKTKISFSAFEKIWEGTTWKGIMDDIYTSDNIKLHKNQAYKKLDGCDNPNAYYTNEEVLEIRMYYVDHTLRETFAKFGNKAKSITGFRAVIDKSYLTSVPRYNKIKKYWTLNNKIINIENYNPVSTILESEE